MRHFLRLYREAVTNRITVGCRSAFGSSALLACLLVVLGCTPPVVKMYSGPEQPSESVATLAFYEPLRVMTVDGQSVPLVSGVVAVLPGPHTIAVQFYRFSYRTDEYWNSGDTNSVTFEAKAGHQYSVKSSGGGFEWKVWVEERTK